MKKLLSILIIITISSCSVYQRPNIPSEQLATLMLEQKEGGILPAGSVAIKKIDGMKPSSSTWILRHRSPLEIAPGKHTLDLDYIFGTSSGDMSLWFIAEPGIKYIVRGKVTGYKFLLWVEEFDSGKVVGGLKGSADEPM